MNMWLSKDDVLKDLADVNGDWRNFDDDYIVRGSRPPPPSKVNEDNDDEINLRFGGYGDQLVNSNYDSGPDLVGIQNMLRMVNTFDKPLDTYQQSNKGVSPRKLKQKEPEIIVISKLNPNVEEFVPKTFQTVVEAKKEAEVLVLKDSHLSEHLHDKKKKTIIQSENKNSVVGKSHAINEESVASTSQLTSTEKEGDLCSSVDLLKIKDKPVSSNMTSTEKERDLCSSVDLLQIKDEPVISNINDEEQEKRKMAALLKSKISTALKEDSFEKKREKNVAIAALLRLNSGAPKALPSDSSDPPQTSTEPLKQPLVLFTPDYFAGPSRPPKEITVHDTEHTIPEPTPLLETNIKPPSPRETHDPIVKESIEKVNNWLNIPDKKAKPKAPVPYIGPVTFKKKESISPKSPCSEVSRKTEPVNVIPKFVPSQNAAKLAKDFEAQVKAKEEMEKKMQTPLNKWTELETELKKRDEAIRNRSREHLDESGGSSSGKNSRPTSRHT